MSEQDGCIVIVDSLFNSVYYNTSENNLTHNFVHNVYEDNHNNSWILTAGGLTYVSADSDSPAFYFHPNSKSGFKTETPFLVYSSLIMSFGLLLKKVLYGYITEIEISIINCKQRCLLISYL